MAAVTSRQKTSSIAERRSIALTEAATTNNKCCNHFLHIIFPLDNYNRANNFSAVFVSVLLKTCHWSIIILYFYRFSINELTKGSDQY